MCRAGAVLPILLLIAGFLSPPDLSAQSAGSPAVAATESRGFRLEQNNPNPGDPETSIPFYLEESLFARTDTGVVTIRIYNMLRKLVAIPVVLDHPSGKNVQVLDLPYTEPGRQVAYWNGRDLDGRRVPSGTYYYALFVNDEPPQFRKMLVYNQRRLPSIFPWPGRGTRPR